MCVSVSVCVYACACGSTMILLADCADETGRMVRLAESSDHLSLYKAPTAIAACAMEPLVVQRAQVVPVLHEETSLSQVAPAHWTHKHNMYSLSIHAKIRKVISESIFIHLHQNFAFVSSQNKTFNFFPHKMSVGSIMLQLISNLRQKNVKTPATLVIDCSFCYRTPSGTGVPSLCPRGF